MIAMRVKPGWTLTAPDGRLINPGEIIEVSDDAVSFYVRMGAAEIAKISTPDASSRADAPRKSVKKPNASKTA